MATIHQTTMSPTKLELLAPWLPPQQWYVGSGEPDLSRVGGFRLDDPDGEVGIEFMFVADVSGAEPVVYHVPMTYRGSPLPGVEEALIGTAEHGVLGTRWIYEGMSDPVLVAQLAALVAGNTVAQAQTRSDTIDPTVRCRWLGPGRTDTDVVVRIRRVLTDGTAGERDGTDLFGWIEAPWRRPGAEPTTGVVAEIWARRPVDD